VRKGQEGSKTDAPIKGRKGERERKKESRPHQTGVLKYSEEGMILYGVRARASALRVAQPDPPGTVSSEPAWETGGKAGKTQFPY